MSTTDRAVPMLGFRLSTMTWWVSVLIGWSLICFAIAQIALTPRVDLLPAFVMTAALTILLELLPLMQGRHHNPQGVVMSTAFVCGVMFIWGPWPAIVIVAIGSLSSDARVGKAWWKVVFNPGQYAMTIFAAWLVVATTFGHATLAHPTVSFHPSELIWMVLAWTVWIIVNFSLVAGVLADESSFIANFMEDFRHEARLTFGVLAISPLVVVLGARSWILLPLLMIPMLILYQTGQIAMQSEHDAGHDALTGLPNRVTLAFDLDRAFADHARGGEPFALMLIDLDDFKRVNDTLGHLVGDALLVSFAQRLRQAVRSGDCVARLGGDEFAVVVFDVDADQAVAMAGAIHEQVSRTILIDSISLEISMSLGIALCPEHGTDRTTLLRRADVAMYSAKERGHPVDTYSPDRDENSSDQLELVGQLRQALNDGDISLVYQPKVATEDSTPIGFEALVRWCHPTRGNIPPDYFIGLAERSGVMPALTARVIELAVEQSLVWRTLGVRLPIAVNISPTDLSGTALVTQVDTLLARHDVDPAMLIFEITERIATKHIDEVRHTLSELRKRGVRISLDDFGTGYSSLLRLSSLAVDEIKIDRAFVTAMDEGDAAVSIVRTIVDLAHGRGLPAIAEGVENHEQWRVLASLGCDSVQGYHIARPMPAAQATTWILSRLACAPLAPLPTVAAELNATPDITGAAADPAVSAL